MKIKDVCLSALFVAIILVFVDLLSLVFSYYGFYRVVRHWFSNPDIGARASTASLHVPQFFAILIIALIFKKFFIHGNKWRIILTGILLFTVELFLTIYFEVGVVKCGAYDMGQAIHIFCSMFILDLLAIGGAVWIVVYLGKRKQKLLAAGSDE